MIRFFISIVDMTEFEGNVFDYYHINKELYCKLKNYDRILSVNSNIDIIIECIIDGYIKNYGNKINIPIGIIKILCQYYGNISPSNIIPKTNDWYSFIDLISNELKIENIKLNKLYDTNMDGFRVNTFHLKCDNKGPTLCIIKNEHEFIFGGYTSISWNNPDDFEYFPDKSAFLYNYSPMYTIFNLKNPLNKHAVRHQDAYGVGFGNGCDLITYDECNKHQMSNSNPIAYDFDSSEFTFTRKFRILNIEVFRVS